MATVAAVATAAAAVGSAAYSAAGSGGGKSGGGAPKMQGMAPWERIFNRGTADINDEERRVMEDSLAQANFMQPEMYKVLGYEPIYDDRGATPENLKALGDKVDELNNRMTEGKETQAENKLKIEENRKKIRDLRSQARKLKGKKNRDERQGLIDQIGDLRSDIQDMRQESKQTKQDFGPLQQEAAAAQKGLSDAETLPRRVIGVKKLDHPADPTQSGGDLYRMAFDLQNESLVRALKGEEPVDATLRHAWDEREQTLRERLRRQLGPDYETSTPGEQALANFDRERGESFSQYNTQITAQLSAETESRATSLSNLTSQRMQQLMYPSSVQAAHALQLGQVASDRLGIAGTFQHERLAQYESAANAHSADQAAAAARGQAISSLINSAGNGIGGAGSSLDRYLKQGGTTNTAYDNSATDPRNVAGM